MKCVYMQGTRSPQWSGELHVTTTALDNDNNNGRPDRKRALIHRCATLEYRTNCQTRYFCKHAPMSRPKIRQKTKKMYAGLLQKYCVLQGNLIARKFRFEFFGLTFCIGGLHIIIGFEVKGLRRLRMHSEHERYYGLGMDALVTARTRNTNVIMVWAWILWLSDALGTRTSLWFGHGCSGYRMQSERERLSGLGMDALVSVCTRNTRYYGLGMDALVSVCIRNTNVIMVWAWMLW